MKKQPEALRLADAILTNGWPQVSPIWEASQELRRLHKVNQELLEVLKEILDGEGKSFRNLWEQARAAIAKAEGEQA